MSERERPAAGRSTGAGGAADPPELETVERELGATGERSELLVAVLLILAAFAAVGFIVAYVLDGSTQVLGVTLASAFALLALAAVLAAARVLPREHAVEARPRFGDPEAQELLGEEIEQGGAGVSRRRLLIGAMGTSLTALGAALVAPLASLGPSSALGVGSAPWRRGIRLLDEDRRPIRPEDVTEGGFLVAFPEGEARDELGSPLVVVRMRPEELELPPERAGWAPGGVLAFSRVCTHAGCAINLYRSPLYEPTSERAALVCPCHYSTFDPAIGGEPIFGPASRALPQLPLAIDADGNLVAADGFSESVGPSFTGVRR